MIRCVCFLQEGQIPQPVVDKLGAGIHHIVTEYGLGNGVDINWIIVPKGQGWTAGKPSTSSVITLTTPPIEQPQRIEILNALCDLWTDNTGCQLNEVVATVMPAA